MQFIVDLISHGKKLSFYSTIRIFLNALFKYSWCSVLIGSFLKAQILSVWGKVWATIQLIKVSKLN